MTNSHVLCVKAVLDKRAAAKLAKPTAAPSELVVRQRTGGKYKAATVAQDPAAGVRLLSAERFNKNLFSFQCTDISNDCQWTVERTFKYVACVRLQWAVTAMLSCNIIASLATNGVVQVHQATVPHTCGVQIYLD